MSEGRVHVVGGAQVILPFRAGGALLWPAETGEAVRKTLGELAAHPAGSLVLLTEEAAALAPDAAREFEEEGAHALLVIPTSLKGKGAGLERMRHAIIRSVGVDLIARSPSEAIGEQVASDAGEEE